jgi:transposase
MAKALSVDLRRRVVNAIERGLSCRQAAERFGVSASSSAIRWRERLVKQGNLAPRKQGGDRKSGRIEAEADFLLGAVAETPDITLAELREKLTARGVSAGVGTLWRFFDRRILPRPVLEFEDQVHIIGARSKRYPCAWFS